jgi:hypothetical protein
MKLSKYGTAIDGYISGATLFLDVNKNGVLDAGEPSTTTDSNGEYNLDIPFKTFDKNQNKGDDLLTGGLGNDSLTGGYGNDRFLLSPNSAIDISVDFEDGKDLLSLGNNFTFLQRPLTQKNITTFIRSSVN